MGNSLHIYYLTRYASTYEEMVEAVVVAVDEWSARQTASESCGDEGVAAWLSTEMSSCKELGVARADIRPGMVCDVTLYG